MWVLQGNFVLSDAENNILRPLKRSVMADLSLLITLILTRQKLQGPYFLELIDSFVLLA